jgi:uncharacterized membrane protein affecting hemolysin expression
MERIKIRCAIVVIYIIGVILATLFLNVCSFIPSSWFAYLFTTILPFYPRIVRYIFGNKVFETYQEQLEDLTHNNSYKIGIMVTNLIFLVVSIIAVIKVPFSLLELVKR